MVENNRAKVPWDSEFQTDEQLLANMQDIEEVEKKQKTSVVLDVAIPADCNIRKTKTEIYQGLKEQLE